MIACKLLNVGRWCAPNSLKSGFREKKDLARRRVNPKSILTGRKFKPGLYECASAKTALLFKTRAEGSISAHRLVDSIRRSIAQGNLRVCRFYNDSVTNMHRDASCHAGAE